MPCVPWHRGAQQIHNQTAPHTGDILLASLFHLDGHLSLPRSQSAIERGHSKNILKIDSSEHLLLFLNIIEMNEYALTHIVLIYFTLIYFILFLL